MFMTAPAAVGYIKMIELHDYVQFFLVVILFFVLWFYITIILDFGDFNSKQAPAYILNKTYIHTIARGIAHLGWLEVIWTIIPILILTAIAIPSFKLLYALDVVNSPLLTLRCIGNQWYWTYECDIENPTFKENYEKFLKEKYFVQAEFLKKKVIPARTQDTIFGFKSKVKTGKNAEIIADLIDTVTVKKTTGLTLQKSEINTLLPFMSKIITPITLEKKSGNLGMLLTKLDSDGLANTFSKKEVNLSDTLNDTDTSDVYTYALGSGNKTRDNVLKNLSLSFKPKKSYQPVKYAITASAKADAFASYVSALEAVISPKFQQPVKEKGSPESIISYFMYLTNRHTQKAASFAVDSYMLDVDELQLGAFRLLEVDNYPILPADAEIRLAVTGTDVIHSYAVPSLGVKIDAIPGRLNQFGIRVRSPGTYYGQCSELCGVGHGFMPIKIQFIKLIK
jgi:heme/copper-type cytochrome/quinol oxidase subunit 2